MKSSPTANPLKNLQPSTCNLQHRRILIFGAILVLAATTGCQRLAYTGPNGEHFSRSSFASTTSISELSVDVTTNGIRRVQMRGYKNDSTQAIGAVTEAAVRAALQSAKP